MERQYLVGLHLSVGTGYGSGGNLDLVYNPNCFAGGPADRPEDLAGSVWADFHMCVQTQDGQPCGNPWGPIDECVAPLDKDRGCVGCHTDESTITWSPGGSEP
jgi:hypothetical protein